SVQYLDENGKRCAVDADGILARVIQHEYDHLDGILFLDRIDEKRRDDALRRYAALRGTIR
ncbi:peptide deformylase, partial [Treponema pallidum]